VLSLCRCCCCVSFAVVSAVPAAVCAVKTTAVWPFARAGSVFAGAACGLLLVVRAAGYVSPRRCFWCGSVYALAICNLFFFLLRS
jgi:hypothetical protein